MSRAYCMHFAPEGEPCPECEATLHRQDMLSAANALMRATEAMGSAAAWLDIIPGDEARIHAAEMRGAARIARQWELKLRRDADANP